MIAVPALTFDAEAHTYRVDGRDVPHVTGVLEAVGVTADFDALPSGARLAALARRELGALVHRAIHYDNEGDLDEATASPDVMAYVEAWRVFRSHHPFTTTEAEVRVYHPDQDYAGTLDAVCDVDGRLVLADAKIGDPADARADLQTGAYAGAWEAMGGPRISERWAVQLRPERPVPYLITPYRSPLDWRRWLACLVVYRLQHPSRRKKVA